MDFFLSRHHGSIKVLQRTRTIKCVSIFPSQIILYTHTYIHTHIQRYCEELAHVIMELDKSQDLHLAS